MRIEHVTQPAAWDAFLASQPFRPFLQSWTVGEMYGDIGQKPVRLTASDETGIRALCFAMVVPARRGKHLSIPYGPLFDYKLTRDEFATLIPALFKELTAIAKSEGCSFIRMSPFLTQADGADLTAGLTKAAIKSVSSPLHLLAEHIWYLPLANPDVWNQSYSAQGTACSEEELLAAMRKTTRNLIGRAGRDGVTVTASNDPVRDLPLFLTLHNETKKRHGFTPYSEALFRAQVARFAPRNECTLYLAHYQGDVIAASIHMHAFGETSYHHGASSSAHNKIPASYLVQWTAIKDALKRGDRVYNFWGVAPPSPLTPNPSPDGRGADTPLSPSGRKGPGDRGGRHPFAGVTLFKTGFGGNLLNLMHATDIPVSSSYWLTYGFETVRKWRRGF